MIDVFIVTSIGTHIGRYIPPPAGSRVGHRMMSSQTGEWKADKGAELVPPAERTKTHTGRPEQRSSAAGDGSDHRQGAGQLQPVRKRGLRWAFRIMDCRDTRGYDVTLTDNQKRALVKRIADIYEKVGVAGLALGLFQYNFQGALIGLGFLTISLLLTYLLER